MGFEGFGRLVRVLLASALLVSLAACYGPNEVAAPLAPTVGGDLGGLAADQQVTLVNNDVDALTLSSNGSFVFATPIAYNGTYAVTVKSQPVGQVCSVARATGAAIIADVTDIAVTCSASSYSVGGTLVGLAAGEQVTLLDNGSDALTLAANGAFTFATPVARSGSYAVTVGTQPTGQVCSVSHGSGSGVTADVGDVVVTCSAITYTVGGTVSGLAGGQQVTLLDNGGDALTLSANGAFTFPTPVPFGGSYAVTVGAQPAGQVCTIVNGSGAMASADVGNVGVNCSTSTYTVGGTVSGLAGGQPFTLLDNGADARVVSINGSFVFATPIAYNGTYNVTVGTQPSGQVCTVSHGSGTAVVADVTSVVVTCSTTTFSIGGVLGGLAGGQQVTLLDNGGDALTLAANGGFTFATPLAYGGSYSVTVGAQPAGQVCSVTHGGGSAVVANVSNVSVTCASDAYTLGGTLGGLAGGEQVTLLDNGGDALTLAANGNFNFATPIAYGASYLVTVGTQPLGQTCTVGNGAGTGTGGNVDDVSVTCSSTTYSIGGTLGGLSGGQQVTLLDNGSDALTLTGNGSFTFATQIAYHGSYNVTVGTQPTSQGCAVTAGEGTSVSANVGDVEVLCGPPFVYATGMGTPAQISGFTVSANGTLDAGSAVPMSSPLGLVIDSTGRYVYALDAGTDSIRQYAVNAGTGALAPMTPATVAVDSGANAMFGDPLGRYLYVVNFQGASVVVYGVGSTGGLTQAGTYSTSSDPYAMTIDPTGHFAYVVGGGSGTISQYTVGTGGSLSPMSPATVATGAGPEAVVVDPTGHYLYVLSTIGSAVFQYTIGSGGQLAAMSPASVPTGVASSFLAVDPTGRYLYVSNGTAGTVSQYTIGATGALGAMSPATVAAGSQPRGVAIDRTGKYVYVANLNDGTISQYAVGSTGALSPMSPTTVSAGLSSPTWIAAH